MTYVDHLSSELTIPLSLVETEEKGHDVTYIVAFAVVGLFFSVLSYTLTPAEWWPEGTVALAPEIASDGLTVSQIPIPAGLQVTEYSTH